MSADLDLTVDICILRSGSQLGDPKYYEPSHQLMQEMEKKGQYALCLDSRGKISAQYLRHLKEGTWGHHWFQMMVSRGKYAIIQWTNLDRGTKTALKEEHFDSGVGEDYKYVVTAAGSQSRVLVSHDPGYSQRVRKILRRRLSLNVNSAVECLTLDLNYRLKSEC